MNHDKGIERLLAVGKPVAVQFDISRKWAPRYTSCVRGWQPDISIMIDRPKDGKRYVPIRDDHECIVRYIIEGNAVAFVSQVLRSDTMSTDAHCHLAWPQQFEVVPFRRFERVLVNLPCQFQVDSSVSDGEVRDLSVAGCGVFSGAYIAETTPAHMTFSLPTEIQINHMPVITRNVRREGDGFFLGFEFAEGVEGIRTDLAFFIKLLLKRNGKDGTDYHTKVLIIEHDTSRLAALQRDFETHGYEVFVATAPLDGLCRFHMFNPDAIVIGQEQKGIRGLDLARMIRATEGLAAFPVFVYAMKNAQEPDNGPDVPVDISFDTTFAASRVRDMVAQYPLHGRPPMEAKTESQRAVLASA